MIEYDDTKHDAQAILEFTKMLVKQYWRPPLTFEHAKQVIDRVMKDLDHHDLPRPVYEVRVMPVGGEIEVAYRMKGFQFLQRLPTKES